MLFFTDIVHRFGIPNYIITDNGTQFTGKKFLHFYDNHHIRVLWSVVAHAKTKWPSRVCQRHGFTRPKAKNFLTN
jgi:hypothetical protein